MNYQDDNDNTYHSVTETGTINQNENNNENKTDNEARNMMDLT